MSFFRPLCLIGTAAALAACGNTATDPAGATPDAALEGDAGPDATPRPALFAPEPAASADDDPQPAEFEDLNPDPAVVEVDLTASETTQAYLPGAPTRVWAYNGRVPGPTLSARPGDRVIVHFHNRLPEATTIHWHGLRVPLDQDGVPVDGGVAPGADRDYDFVVPDAGTFWYHPHVRSDEQVERGLYGAIRVAEAVPLTETEVPERVLVLDDVLLEAGATLTGAWLAAGVVDELVVYYAPRLLGDTARPLALLSTDTPDPLAATPAWCLHEATAVGTDLRVTWRRVAT